MSGSNSSAPDALPPPGPEAGRPRLEPLAMTVHGLPSGLLDAPAQRTRRGRLTMLMVLAVCAAPVLISYFMFYVVKPGGTAYGTLISPPVDLPAGQVLDLQGQPVPLGSLRRQWVLIVVGGGDCDAACEQRLHLQRQLREMLGRERDRLDKVWLINDAAPVRPDLQRALAQGVAPQILRVDPAQLAGWLKPQAGQPVEAHLYLLDPEGRWMMRMPPQPQPARVKADLERLLRASSFWDKPGR